MRKGQGPARFVGRGSFLYLLDRMELPWASSQPVDSSSGGSSEFLILSDRKLRGKANSRDHLKQKHEGILNLCENNFLREEVRIPSFVQQQ